MAQSHLLTAILVLGVTSLFVYKASFLKNRRIFRLSLFQIFYMILLPAICALLINSYVNSIILLPHSNYRFISDTILKNAILLAILFTYGGQSVHIITKSLSEAGLRDDNSEVAQLNKYLHLTFSHNLVFCGLFLITISLALLELNHVSAYEYDKLYIPIIRGIIFGFVFVGSMYRYTRSEDEYSGRWADLKISFLLGWIAMIIIGYLLTRYDANVKEYQLLLPALLGFVAINIVNVFLVLRHVKNRKNKKSVQI